MKTRISLIAGSILLTGALVFGLHGVGQTLASGIYDGIEDDSEHEEHDDDEYYFASVKQNPLYNEECGSCHMVYPAALLPPGSWQKIMAGLEDHFGENAELDATATQAIENYLVQASASSRNRKLLRNLGTRTPRRITKLPYFVHEHDEIPRRFIVSNDKVNSLSQCDACHQDAERGRFDEDDIFIPGVGRWDD